MAWELDLPDVWIEPDNGTARQIQHIQQPFPDGNGTDNGPLLLAATYLTKVASRLGLQQSQVDWLIRSISDVDPDTGSGPPSPGDGAQLRWRRPMLLRDETAVITIQQTFRAAISRDLESTRPVDVYRAGIRIVMHRSIASNSWRVTDSNNTLRSDFNLRSNDALLRAALVDPFDDILGPGIDAARVRSWLLETLPMFGLPPVDPRWILVEPVPWLYRFDPIQQGLGTAASDPPPESGSDDVAWGFHVLYPGGLEAPAEGMPARDTPSQDLIVRFDKAPLARLELLTHAMAPITGKVFTIDPASASGDVGQARPSSFSKDLNPYRVSQPLLRLAAPAGLPPLQSLSGANVYVFDPTVTPGTHPGSIGITPPLLAAGDAFDFDARTNDFAAVNAYYHTDALLQMVSDFGFPFSDNPTGVTTPLEVVHRATIDPGTCNDGRCINAQFRVNGPPPGFSAITGTAVSADQVRVG